MTTPHPLEPDLTPRLDEKLFKGRDGKRYHADAGLVAAANVALTLGRPLLLTGEPGCGKTDFAWAAAGALAAALGHDGALAEPLQCYVRSDTRARDLLYTYDAVQRFGDAQHGGSEGAKRASDPRHYLTLEPLGRALVSSRRRAVLIDEIDKAPRDLPNDLLRELEQKWFEIPEIPADLPPLPGGDAPPLQRAMRRPAGAPPLIIITSNVERQLPDAFLRRCVFWHIEFPRDLLPDILDEHCPEASGSLRGRAVAVFNRLRAAPGLSRRPGTAELIDWVNALSRVYQRAHAEAQLEKVAQLLDAGGRGVPWLDLPALGCLVKLREDREALARA